MHSDCYPRDDKYLVEVELVFTRTDRKLTCEACRLHLTGLGRSAESGRKLLFVSIIRTCALPVHGKVIMADDTRHANPTRRGDAWIYPT